MRATISTALALAMLLAACGGAASPSAAPSQPAPASPSSAAAKPASAAAGTSASAVAKPAASASASAKPAAASAGASPSSSGAKQKITIGYTSFTMDQLAPMVAKETGLFDQNGLDADVVSIGAGSQPNAALMSNQIQMYEGGPEAVAATVAGADLEFVAAADTAFLFWLYSIPSVKTGADLKGKTIAVTSLTSSTYTAAKIGVKSLGIDPDKDVVYAAVNNPPAILAAIQNGAVQAGSIGSSNIVQVKKTNLNLLVDIASLGVPYPAGWPVVSKKWADSHDDIMQRMMKAYVQGIAYMEQNAAGTQKILSKYSKSDDQEFLKGNYDLVLPHLQKVPYADVKGVQLVLDGLVETNPAAKGANPNKFVDNHWIKALDDNGFIAGLYKK
ncbi:MAG: ABC transporter substrate-binding protein [Chloroflexota bacterium]